MNLAAQSGTVTGGGEIRLAARSEFPNNSDITVQNLTVTNSVDPGEPLRHEHHLPQQHAWSTAASRTSADPPSHGRARNPLPGAPLPGRVLPA